MTFPTGEQYELSTRTASGELRATITGLAAAIRQLSLDGVDLVETYGEESSPPYGAGIVLVPWPNRIRDGRWEHEGVERQLDITEPKLNNAIHGLLRYTEYREVDRTQDSVTLAATVYPQHGYPYLLETAVHYELVSDGLKVTHYLRNLGHESAPVAVGTHPFLRIGDVPTDSLTLQLSAASHIEVDDRLLPTSEVPVEGTEWDLRDPRQVSELQLDDAWGEAFATDGEVVHTLTAPDGRTVSMWSEPEFGFVQVFTTRQFPGREGDAAIAIEPMTAPADAFNSGKGLRWLAPGDEWEISWGIRFGGF